MPTRRRTLVDALRAAARSEREGLRVLDRRGNATWRPWPVVYQRAREVAGGLQGLGIRPGDRVAIIFPTNTGFLDACFGVLLAGAVPVPLYPPVRLGRLDEYHPRTAAMVGAAGARLVVADSAVKRLLGETVALARPALGCLTLADLPAGAAGEPAVAETDLGLVQFSSGTTREPKAVALSHRALVAQAEMLNGFWPESDAVPHSGLSWLPLYHDMGLIGCVLTALVRPGTLTLLPPESFVARPASWLQAISRYRATISPAPNFAYSVCVSRIADEEMEGVDLSSWRVALNGAEQVVPGVLRAFNERFARWGLSPEALTPVYGLSEAALAVTFSDVRRPFLVRRFDREALTRQGMARESDEGRELASVGRPVPGLELRIVGARGETLPDGRVGLVECRGPCVMEGYLAQPAATAQVLRDGWLNTGDLGFLCAGELFLTGRAKDMLLLRGRNHAPDEVERAAERAAGVRAGCVVACTWLPDPSSDGAGEACTGDADGEHLLVLAEARRGLSRTAFPEIERACGAEILRATGLSADRVVVLMPGTLPRTSSGKLRRQEALARFLAGTLAPPAPVTGLSLAAAFARSSLAFLRLRRERG